MNLTRICVRDCNGILFLASLARKRYSEKPDHRRVRIERRWERPKMKNNDLEIFANYT